MGLLSGRKTSRLCREPNRFPISIDMNWVNSFDKKTTRVLILFVFDQRILNRYGRFTLTGEKEWRGECFFLFQFSLLTTLFPGDVEIRVNSLVSPRTVPQSLSRRTARNSSCHGPLRFIVIEQFTISTHRQDSLWRQKTLEPVLWRSLDNTPVYFVVDSFRDPVAVPITLPFYL